MRRWLIGLAVLSLVPLVAGAQEYEPGGEETGLKNVQLVVDPGTHTAPMRSLVFSHDGSRLFTFGYDRSVQVWRTETGRRERFLRLPLDLKVGALGGEVAMGIAISPNDRTLAVAGGSRTRNGNPEHPILLINLEDGKYRTLVGAHTTFTRLTFSPDGKWLAGTHTALTAKGERTIHVWDVAEGGEPLLLRQHEDHVHALSFSHNDLLATASEDKTVRIWNLGKKRTSTVQATLTHSGGVLDVAWSADGKHLATVVGGSVHYWAADGARPIRSFNPADLSETCAKAEAVGIKTVQFLSPDRVFVTWHARVRGERLTGGASILEVKTGKAREAYSFAISRPEMFNGALSPDGKWAALLDIQKLVLWPVGQAKKARFLTASSSFPGDVGWGKDGAMIAWGGDLDETSRRSEPGPLTHTLNLKELEVRSSKEGLPNVVGPQMKLGEWEIAHKGAKVLVYRNGKQVQEVQAGPHAVLVSQGRDRVLITRSTKAPSISLLDPVTGDEVKTIGKDRSRGSIFRMAASPDGKYLLVGTMQQRLQILSIETGEQLLSLYVSGEDWVAWTKEGYYAASPGGERMMGWLVQEKEDQIPAFHPAARLRDRMYRPDLIQLLLDKGSVKAALEAVKTTRAKAKGPADLGKLLPPRVKLEVLDRRKQSDEVKVRATADAGVDAQPVASLCLILDGKPALAGKATATFEPAIKKGAAAEWTVKLPPGNHRLAVFARSTDTSALSDEIDATGPESGPKASARLHLLCFGVSKYANHGKGADNGDLELKYAAKDAKEIAGVLEERCGNGRLFSIGSRKVLLDQDATSKKVLAELENLTKDTDVKSSDLAVIYFSCHGEKADDGKLWLLTHEADRARLKDTCLSGEKLKEVLRDMPCRVLLLLDACKSAAGSDPRRRASVTNDLTAMLTEEDCGVAVITAARGTEFALEDWPVKIDGKEQKLKNGLFTWALRQALEGKAMADPYDGRVYTHDVYQHVFREVQHWSGGRQHPCLGIPWGAKPLPLVLRETTSPGEK